jgi:integrase
VARELSEAAELARELSEAGRPLPNGLPPARIELVDVQCDGLRLRISPAGSKTWSLLLRDLEGRIRRHSLGDYPTVGIADAREAARSLRVDVRRDGKDPTQERRRMRAVARDAKAGIGTLAALLDQYEKAKGHELKSWSECKRRIESVFEGQLMRPLERLTLVDLQHAADTWPSKQSAAAAVRYLRPILKFAAHRRLIAADTTTIHPPATVGRRDRILSREELCALLPELSASDRPYAAAMRFMLLTLCRREEAAAALWRDVDLEAKVWTIPDTKSGRPHTVPLSTQAVGLLADRMPRDKRGKPITPAGDTLVFTTETGGALSNWDRESKRLMEASDTEGWTRHDLRRTGATICGQLGVAPHVIESALNHASIHSQLAGVYNQHRYGREVAEALQLLADYLDEIVSSAPSDSASGATQGANQPRAA